MNHVFSRLLLRETMRDVHKALDHKQTKDAWVWTSDRRTWEFHFRHYFTYFHASDAYEAKSKGWESYLSATDGGKDKRFL